MLGSVPLCSLFGNTMLLHTAMYSIQENRSGIKHLSRAAIEFLFAGVGVGAVDCLFSVGKRRSGCFFVAFVYLFACVFKGYGTKQLLCSGWKLSNTTLGSARSRQSSSAATIAECLNLHTVRVSNYPLPLSWGLFTKALVSIHEYVIAMVACMVFLSF